METDPLPAILYTSPMDDPSPALLAAIEAGRGQRSPQAPQAWSRHRARVLTAVQQGIGRVRIAGQFGVGVGQLRVLIAEACDAVLRGGAASDEADAVCAAQWQRWCDGGDGVACERVQRGSAEPA
jgi:hypothetical protein